MPAIVLLRVSSKSQREALRIQEQDCRAFCASHHLPIVEVCSDIESRDVLDERPALLSIRQRMRSGTFDTLVVWKFDRLSGDILQQAVILYEAQKAGVTVLSVHESYEDSPVGQFLMQAQGFVSASELHNIRMRTARGRRQRVEDGLLYPHPRPLYGYQWADEKKSRYRPHPETAPVVVTVFERLAAGESIHAVCRFLTEQSIPSPQGKDWGHSSLSRLIHNPAYWGEATTYRTQFVKRRVLNAQTGLTERKKRQVKSQTTLPLSTETIPPLVSKALAIQAHTHVKENLRLVPKGKSNPDQFLLRGGFVRCAHCKRPMSAHTREDHTLTYRCTTPLRRKGECSLQTILQRHLDDATWEEVTDILHHPERLQDAFEEYTQTVSNPAQAEQEALRAEKTKLSKQRERLTQAITDGEDDETLAPLVGLYKTLGTQLLDIDQRLKELGEEEHNWEFAHQGLNDLAGWCQSVCDTPPHTMKEKQQVLFRLGVEVYVWRRDTRTPRFLVTFNPLRTLLPNVPLHLRNAPFGTLVFVVENKRVSIHPTGCGMLEQTG